MSVKRYDLVTRYRGHESCDEMEYAEDGTYVRHDDYAELEAKCAALSVQVELSIAAERAWERTMMYACGEDGPKSVADKFAELESKLETALRECRSAGITIDNLEAKCAALAAENASLKQSEKEFNDFCREEFSEWEDDVTETPSTDAFLAEVRAQGVGMFAAILKVAGICEHPYLDAAIDLAAKLRQDANSARLQRDEPTTDNTNQQFESLSRGDK